MLHIAPVHIVRQVNIWSLAQKHAMDDQKLLEYTTTTTKIKQGKIYYFAFLSTFNRHRGLLQ